METRKIIIVNERTQAQSVIQESKATTLGELKAEMRALNIGYDSEMTFYEGHARVELVDDSSVLPSNIPYKGQIVNDLTFMISKPDKKITSGMTRSEILNKIKALALQEKCKSEFGKNFTQCSNDILITLINNTENSAKPVEMKVENPVEEKHDSQSEEKRTCSESDNIVSAIRTLVEDLYAENIIGEHTRDKVTAVLKGTTYKAPEKMSQREIDEMFNFVKR